MLSKYYFLNFGNYRSKLQKLSTLRNISINPIARNFSQKPFPTTINDLGEYLKSKTKEDYGKPLSQKEFFKAMIIKDLNQISADKISLLIFQLRQSYLLDREVGQVAIDYIHKNLQYIEPNNLILTLKSIQESILSREMLNNIQWDKIEQYLQKCYGLKMDQIQTQVLCNLTFLIEHFSQDFNELLCNCMINLLNKQKKMPLQQSQWVSIILQGCNRINQSRKLSEKAKVNLRKIVREYAMVLHDKLQFSETQSNNIAIICYHLRKLDLSNIPKLYISLENKLLENVDKIYVNYLILAIQSFDSSFLHSQKLFRAIIDQIFKKTQKFETLQFHEFVSVTNAIQTFWSTQKSSNIIQQIGDLTLRFLNTEKNIIEKQGFVYFYHQIERLYFAFTQSMVHDDIREKLRKKLLQMNERSQLSQQIFLAWVMCIDQQFDDAQQLIHKITDQQSLEKQMMNIKTQRLFYHTLYILNVLGKQELSQKAQLLMSELKEVAKQKIIKYSEAQAVVIESLKEFLNENKLEYEEEADTGYYPVDLVLKKQKIVIEIQGIYHYIGDTVDQQENAKNRLKCQILEKLGYQVMSINYMQDYLIPLDKRPSKRLITEQLMKKLKMSKENDVN